MAPDTGGEVKEERANKTDVQVLIQFAKDQGWDLQYVVEAYTRLEEAIEKASLITAKLNKD